MSFLFIFIGGGLGSLCRYGLVLLLQPWQHRFPWATLAANALACVVLGVLLGWQMQGQLTERNKWLLTTGFCGGFSTFSTFTAESLQLFNNGQGVFALLNVLGNLALCFLCLLLGLKIA